MAWENFIISDAQGILSADQINAIPETPTIGWTGTTIRKGTLESARTEFNARISGGSEITNNSYYIDNSNYRLTGIMSQSGDWLYAGISAYDVANSIRSMGKNGAKYLLKQTFNNKNILFLRDGIVKLGNTV